MMSYLVDYHTHPAAHGEITQPVYCEEYLLKFVEKAELRGIKELGFSDHERFLEQVDLELIHYLKKTCRIKILFGLEFDFFPGREEEIRELQRGLPLDYSIGSVHHLGDWEFDHPDYIDRYQQKDINELYEWYFNLVKKAAASKLFPVMGHLDLIKVFGFKPRGMAVGSLAEPVLKEIQQLGLVIEINTNGNNKPVGEFYPSREILRRAFELNIPITFGSDAHHPGRTGEGIEAAARLAWKIGYRRVAAFQDGQPVLKPLNKHL